GALGQVDGAGAAAALADGRSVSVPLPDGTEVVLAPDEVELRVKAQPGFSVSRDGGEVVALDLGLDEGLRARGLVREVVRHVQDLRKAAGFEVSDTIVLYAEGLDDLADHLPAVAREVLAVEVVSG